MIHVRYNSFDLQTQLLGEGAFFEHVQHCFRVDLAQAAPIYQVEPSTNQIMDS